VKGTGQAPTAVDWFAGAEHDPFSMPGLSGGALMLHGFMGTPKELRPIAEELNSLGMHVNVPLLPGFGKTIESLDNVTRSTWIAAAEVEWRRLHARGMSDVLVGYSMGGSIAVRLAKNLPPKKLVLIAPLWKLMGGGWKLKLLPVVKHIVREIRPFAQSDFNDPNLRQFFESATPELDLEDKQSIEWLRTNVSLRTAVIDELRRLSQETDQLGRTLKTDTLILQGTDDESVFPKDTRELAATIDQRVRYVEIKGDHLLVDPSRGSWNSVVREMRSFLGLDREVPT
jgi:carboxylesterase